MRIFWIKSAVRFGKKILVHEIKWSHEPEHGMVTLCIQINTES